MMEAEKTILYHLTSIKKLPAILKEGLVPQNGEHCKKLHDRSSDIVFLCKEEDIKFWMKCFYDVDVLIEIDCSSFKADLRRRPQRNAPSKAEYGCIHSISPEYFIQVSEVKIEDGISNHEEG